MCATCPAHFFLIQIISGFFNTQVYPPYCYFLLLWSKYSPQHLVLKYPQLMKTACFQDMTPHSLVEYTYVLVDPTAAIIICPIHGESNNI